MSSVNSRKTHIVVAVLSETHLKCHERFFIPNYHFYQTDAFPGRRGRIAIAVRETHFPQPCTPAYTCFNRSHRGLHTDQ
jgi:hypothetical protein